MMLFENAGKVNWSSVKEALPVFLMCVFIPFTYSIFNGVVFGFGIYVILAVVTSPRAVVDKMKDLCGCATADDESSSPSARQHSFDSSRYSDYAQTLSFELNEIYSGGQPEADGSQTEGIVKDYHPLLGSAEPSSSSAAGVLSATTSSSGAEGGGDASTSKTAFVSRLPAASSKDVIWSGHSSSRRHSNSDVGSINSAHRTATGGGGGGGGLRSINAGIGSLLFPQSVEKPDWALDS
jgi:hypothetical protein